MLQDSLPTSATSLKVVWGIGARSPDATPGPRSGFLPVPLASGSAAPDTVEGSWNPDSFYELSTASVATL